MNPTEIKLLQKLKEVHIRFENGEHFVLSCEYLRVFSPSAEVRGHGAGTGTLPMNKKNVNIVSIEPVGNYAVKLVFDDGHDTGLYTWEYLYQLSCHQKQNWQEYLARLTSSPA